MKRVLSYLIAAVSIIVPAVSAGALQVQSGVAQYSNGQTISFPTAFPSTPVVVTSAQKDGEAVMCCPTGTTATGFAISIITDEKRPVSDAWVQWIAVIPDGNANVMAGSTLTSNQYQITLRNMPSTPIVVACAQKYGEAVIAAAGTTEKNKFVIDVRDTHNAPMKNATVNWIAVVPNSTNGFKGGCTQRNNASNIGFSPAFGTVPVYIVSGQYNNEPCACAAVNNRKDGFLLYLTKHDGTSGTNVWTQWLGYAKP